MIRRHWAALALITLFIGLGVAFLPLPGLQNDEALFAGPLYHPDIGFRVHLFGFRIPLMLMSYLGSLKTWLYAPLLAAVGPDIWALRLPTLIAGAGTIWLFYRLTEETSGRLAGISGAALLSTDPSLLLTTCFDWGPVALQLLLGCGALFTLVRLHSSGRVGWAAASGGLIGLALWNKALFVWPVAGAIVAAAVTGPALRLLRGAGAVCFLAGLLACSTPLLIYNAKARGLTASENIAFDFKSFGGKFDVLRFTLAGSGLLGYLVTEDPPASPRSNLNAYALAGSLAAIPFLRRRSCFRPMVFAAVWMAVTWLLMAVTRGAGGSVHHTVLLWPAPAFLISVALVEATRRLSRPFLAVAILTTILAGASLAVTLEHYRLLRSQGSPRSWTDAIFALTPALESSGAPRIFLTDWGMFDSLLVLGNGRLPIRLATDPLTHNPPADADRNQLRQMLKQERALFVGHTPDYEQFQGTRERLVEMAASEGYTKQIDRVVPDRQGRPVYEVFRFLPRSP